MSLSDHVTLSITQDSSGIARDGFGTPMILSANASFPERLRYYSDVASIAADGFATTSPEYLAARAVFSQDPHPPKVAIGKCLNKPQLTYQIGVAAVRSSWPYPIDVAGQALTPGTVTATSAVSDTNDGVVAKLVAALNAFASRNFTAEATGTGGSQVVTVMGDAAKVVGSTSFTADSTTDEAHAVAHGLVTGDGPVQVSNTGGGLPAGLAAVTNYWVIVVDVDNFKFATSRANALAGTAIDLTTNGTGTQAYVGVSCRTLAPGAWFSLAIRDPADLSNKMTHVDPGVAADLDAIKLYDNGWYGVLTHYNSKAFVEGVAAWTEAVAKIYVGDVVDTESITTAPQSTPDTNHDTGQSVNARAYAHTALAYHRVPAEFMAAAWDGDVFPIDPGDDDWKFRTLTGVSPDALTQTHHDNLVARKMNGYYTVAARNMTFDGTVADGNYIDVIRGLHWLEDDMTKAVFGVLVGSAGKVAFTDNGVQQIVAAIRGSLKRAADRGIITADFTVIFPKVADISDADKAARKLTGIKFLATLQGAIHKVEITGNVSV